MDLEKFELLGRKVESLLARVEASRTEAAELTLRLKEREAELEALRTENTELHRERAAIREQIDALIARISEHEGDPA